MSYSVFYLAGNPSGDMPPSYPTGAVHLVPAQASEANSAKKEESYAQLLFKAFMTKPQRAMTLREIYQWFRENTDKGKDNSNGWQNSIRYNLSKNVAFSMRDRSSSNDRDAEGDSSTGNGSNLVKRKKPTEWYLEPSAYKGVPRTRRNGDGGKQGRSATGHSHSASRRRTRRDGDGAKQSRSATGHGHSASRRKMATPNSPLSGRILCNATTDQGITAALHGTTASAINFAAAVANHTLQPCHFPTTGTAMFSYPGSDPTFIAAFCHHPQEHNTSSTSYEHHPQHTSVPLYPTPGSVVSPTAAAEAAYPWSVQNVNVVGVDDEAEDRYYPWGPAVTSAAVGNGNGACGPG